MARPPISVQLYSVREALAADFDGTIARVAELGFRTVEPYGLTDRPADFAAAFARNGISAPTSHASFLGGDLDRAFEAATIAGVQTLIDPFIPSERWQTADDIAVIADSLNAAAAVAERHGIRVGYHNHEWELATDIDGTPALEHFATLLDPGVALEVDTYWSAVGGVDPIGLLERLGSRVVAIHVKDGPISHDTAAQTAVGGGRMPVLDILAAAPHVIPVVELDDFTGDMFDALADSFAYLTSNGVDA